MVENLKLDGDRIPTKPPSYTSSDVWVHTDCPVPKFLNCGILFLKLSTLFCRIVYFTHNILSISIGNW